MRSRSWRISQLMSGSRLPVGSSAMISRGSWTRARAMAVRCCSPPDSWAGIWLGLGGQPDERQHPVDRRRDPAARRAGHLERERDVLPDRLGRQQLEVLEDDPDLAAHLRAPGGAAAGRGPGRRARPRPAVAISSRMSSLMSVDLPAPDGPTRNTKSPSGMTRSTSRSATLPFGYCFVTSCSTRTARSCVACSLGRRRTRSRMERVGGRGWGEGQGRLRGWPVRRHASPARASWTPSAGTARGATS